MPKVSVENLKPGMKLAKPVMNEGGMVLLGPGTELTAASISRLVNMSIGSVTVEGSSKPAKPKEELFAEIDARFKKTESEPNMSLLKKILQEHTEALYK
ncbi:MAG: hypothetical protein EPN22_16655 [Nitrospirae bacterium]|nr:MAG: hypothetical protein EPN22_16655 [Nitrospirota bacterium]